MNERFTCKGLTIFENGEEIHTIKATGYLNSQSDRIKQMDYDYRELEKKYDALSNESSELRGRVSELEKTNKYLLLLLDNLTNKDE